LSIFEDHHVIPRWFSDHPVVELLSRNKLFDIEAASNRLYMPSDRELARNMGLSPHKGVSVGSYATGVGRFLGQLQESDKFSIAQSDDKVALAELAAELKTFQTSMKVALINGDLHTNYPVSDSNDAVNDRNKAYYSANRDYATKHADQVEVVNDLQRELGASDQADADKWVSLLTSDKATMAEKLAALQAAMENQPNTNLVSQKAAGDLDRFLQVYNVLQQQNKNPSKFTALDPGTAKALGQTPGFPLAPREPTANITVPTAPDPREYRLPGSGFKEAKPQIESFPIGPKLPPLEGYPVGEPAGPQILQRGQSPGPAAPGSLQDDAGDARGALSDDRIGNADWVFAPLVLGALPGEALAVGGAAALRYMGWEGLAAALGLGGATVAANAKDKPSGDAIGPAAPPPSFADRFAGADALTLSAPSDIAGQAPPNGSRSGSSRLESTSSFADRFAPSDSAAPFWPGHVAWPTNGGSVPPYLFNPKGYPIPKADG
jgi:hypothetical protein